MQSWHTGAPLSSNPIAPSEESSPDGLDRAGAWSVGSVRASPEAGRMRLECTVEAARPPPAPDPADAEE